MFVIVIGTRAAGKTTVKEYLIEQKSFKHVRLVSNNNTTPDGDASTSILSETQDETAEAMLQIPPVTPVRSPKGTRPLLSNTSSSTTNIADITAPNAIPPDVDGALGFTDPSRLLDFITRNWRDNFVTEDITTRTILEPFLKRPSVLLVSVDAPALARFRRYNARTEKCAMVPPLSATKFSFFSDTIHLFGSRSHTCHEGGESSDSGAPSIRQQSRTLSLEEFIVDDDRVSYGEDSKHVTSTYLFASQHLCHINIINTFPTVEDLHNHLESVNLLNMDRLRPSWDSYFMKLASLASHRSNCMKRRVGAILVKDHTIIATGYNGTPYGVPNCNEGGCRRCNEGVAQSVEGFEECLCIHAEENALLEAGRDRLGKNAIIYCNTCPCLKCTIKIVQNGVREVVYNLSYKMDASSAHVFEMAGVKLRQYSPPG